MPISIDKFIERYESEFGEMKDNPKAHLKDLLGCMNDDSDLADPRHAAYMLATVKHECANTYAPIEEYGKGKGRKYGIPDPHNGQTYFGRGYVQLTWKENYSNMGRILKIDLVAYPELALMPETAYKIMSYGMRNGSFTGSKLSTHINGNKCDYVGARRIINGQDCAEKIAGYAHKFETILMEAK